MENKSKFLKVRLICSKQKKKPCIEIRSITTIPDQIKKLIECADQQIPYIIQPHFTNRLFAMNTLTKHKVIKYNPETKTYEYMI